MRRADFRLYGGGGHAEVILRVSVEFRGSRVRVGTDGNPREQFFP
jgi:hypothetical protein